VDSEHLEAYLSGELDETGRHQVEHALRHDTKLRESFVVQAQMAASLQVLLGSGSGEGKAAFEQGVIARLRSEGAGDRGFAKSVLLEIVEEREGETPDSLARPREDGDHFRRRLDRPDAPVSIHHFP
jgi:hypothetical protein